MPNLGADPLGLNSILQSESSLGRKVAVGVQKSPRLDSTLG
jgi:hypothetical protein